MAGQMFDYTFTDNIKTRSHLYAVLKSPSKFPHMYLLVILHFRTVSLSIPTRPINMHWELGLCVCGGGGGIKYQTCRTTFRDRACRDISCQLSYGVSVMGFCYTYIWKMKYTRDTGLGQHSDSSYTCGMIHTQIHPNSLSCPQPV